VIDQLAVHGVNGTEIDGAVAGDGSLFVQVSLTTANGPGMFRLSVSASAPRTIETQPGETLVRHDDGTVVVTGGIANNCIQHAYAYAYRPDGTMVYVGVASCLAWNGRANIATHPPLTLDQAVALATDPAIGRTIAADVEAAGEAKFGHAPTLP
jgi:hypothetical protein